MRFEPTPPTAPYALIFPGQGAHAPEMLEPFRHAPSFESNYARVKSLLGFDPLVGERINENAVSSLLTVLASVSALELLAPAAPVAVAGYSVGQWTALFAAGVIGIEDLIRIVLQRARFMDACVEATGQSGMLSVIGVKSSDLTGVIERVNASGVLLELTNDNAPGQVTLGGSVRALELAGEQLAVFKPKRMARVPVAGAWHSSFLALAVPKLGALLDTTTFTPARMPVADNTTGGWLPEDPIALKAALARQVAMPVLWRQCVASLIERGATTVLEVGFGDVLTKFGFFIDRKVKHEAVLPPPRPARG